MKIEFTAAEIKNALMEWSLKQGVQISSNSIQFHSEEIEDETDDDKTRTETTASAEIVDINVCLHR